MYLTGNDRIRYKTYLDNRDGQWVLCDIEWREFVDANVPSQTETVHFIKQGADDYYVTVYDRDGAECEGYDRRTVGPRLLRCLTTYIPGNTVK